MTAVPLQLGELLGAGSENVREAAWEQLISQHTRLLLAVARSFGGGKDEAMDRYAFILEKLRESDFRRLRSYRSDAGASFSTWLTIAARRLCLDQHRSVYGRARVTNNSERSEFLRLLRRNLVDAVGDESVLESVPEPLALSPESRTVISERDRILSEELEKMPPRARLLLTLRFQDDLTVSRIAAVVGLPNQFSAYREINSILLHLRAALVSRGIDSSAG